MSENPLIDQIIKDLKWHCSSWKCHVYMNMKGYDTKLDLFTGPSPMDIFSFTESKMRSATNHWFLDDFQYPTHSLKDVVASLQSHCLDAGTPLVVRDYYKQSCTLQCKYHRTHRVKNLPQDSLYEQGIRSTCFIGNKHRCSRGISGQTSNCKSSINQITDTSSCCGVRITISLCSCKKGYFINPGVGCNIHRNHSPSTRVVNLSFIIT